MPADPLGDLAPYADQLGDLAELAPRVEPSPAVRARLFASIERDAHAPALAALFDLSVDTARSYLGRTDWRPTGLPGIEHIRVAAGPAWAHADCRLLRMAAHSIFPPHVHDGAERTLLLEGHATTSDGHELASGDHLDAAAGSTHSITVADEPCVFAVRSLGMKLI